MPDRTTTAVILHGWGAEGARWQDFANKLEREGYSVYIPDLPGFGETEPPPESGWTVEEYAEWVKNYLKRHSIKRCFLLGHSFGGRVAIVLTARNPGLIEKLVLVAPAGIPEKKNFRQRLAKMLTVMVPNFLKSSLPFRAPRKLLYKLAGSYDYPDAQSSGMKNTFSKVVSQDLSGFLPQIQVSVLIIWGTRDSFVSRATVERMNDLLPDSRLKIIVDAGHAIYRKQPYKILPVITDFLKS